MAENREGVAYCKMYLDTWSAIQNQPITTAQKRKLAYAYLEVSFEGRVTDAEKFPKSIRGPLQFLLADAERLRNASKGGRTTAKNSERRGRYNFESIKEPEENRQTSDKKLIENLRVAEEETTDVFNPDYTNEQDIHSDQLANTVSQHGKPTNPIQSIPSQSSPSHPIPVQSSEVKDWCPRMMDTGLMERADGFFTLQAIQKKLTRFKIRAKDRASTRFAALETSYKQRTGKDDFTEFMNMAVRREACERCDGRCVHDCYTTALGGLCLWDESIAATPIPYTKKLFLNGGMSLERLLEEARKKAKRRERETY